MKTFALTAAAAMLLAGPAFAQDSNPTPRDRVQSAPSFQQGSGNRAGGPANELNTTGPMTGGPATTGTVIETMPAPSSPNNVPVYQRGTGQQSGGPANELNPR